MIELSPEIITFIFVIGIVGAVLTGYPIAIALGGTGFLIGWLVLGPPVFEMVYSRIYSQLQVYVLVSIPLFIFMGEVLERSQVTNNLYEALHIWLGRIAGGLALSTILFGTILAACLGIIAPSITMLTVIALKPMVERGYNRAFASGAICAGGCLGILIPPSIMLVVYGPMAGISVGQLFMGAVFPGLLLSALYCFYIAISARIQPYLAPPIAAELDVPLKAKIGKLFSALVPPIFLVLAVMGTLFFGLATPTEASGIGAVASILLALAYRKFNWRVLKSAALSTLTMSSFVILIAVLSFAIVGIFLRLGCGDVVAKSILAAPLGHWGAFFIVMFIVFILGFFIDWWGIVFILVPVLTPIIPALGFNPLWFSMMICVNLQTSFMTPPFATAIFICQGSAPPEIGLKMSEVIRGVMPFVVIVLIGLLLCIAFPEIILWLPSKMIT